MKYELSVEGMSCGHCVMAVKEALGRVEHIQVEHVEIGTATIETANMASVQPIIMQELEEEGFPLSSTTLL